MPWLAGNYTKGNSATGGWVGDASNGIGIEAGRHDTQDNDFALGINQCLNKDGSNAATGDLNLGGKKLTNVAVGTASNDAITLSQAQAGFNISGTTLSLTNTRFSADATGSTLTFAKSRGAAVGINTIVQNGDQIGVITFAGANGTAYTNAAAIVASIDEVPGATNDMPGALRFYTTPDGSGLLTERLIIKNDGKVGIGTSSPAEILHLRSSEPRLRLEDTDGGGAVCQVSGNSTAGSITLQADPANIAASSTIAFDVDGVNRMTIDSTGRIAMGSTSTNGRLDVTALTNAITLSLRGRASDNDAILMFTGDAGTETARIECDTTLLKVQKDGANPIIFTSNSTERARFAGTDGHFCVGTTDTAPANNNVTGAVVRTDGLIEASRAGTSSGGIGLRVNRRTDDGTMVEFLRAATTVGSISVASGTVSYNAFSGSHWSQLEDGSRPEIPVGTVLESIGEMCEWPNEVEEVLPKVKISDTAASPAVYGVFSAWDNCWDETNDLYVTSLGAFLCRVGAGVTVAVGDLLESNGDGTARVQTGTEIKASTIGKVTSTHQSHIGEDGSYCVPTVLYCG
jgi:hypothetical protein